MDVIEAAGLGKRYGRKWGLRDCTLSVPAGRVTGLVGPNGSGKTTLLSLAVRASPAAVVGLPAGQPLVAGPAHRGRLAARRVTPPHRRGGPAAPAPPGVTPAQAPKCGLPHRLTIIS
jgi:ABC transporter